MPSGAVEVSYRLGLDLGAKSLGWQVVLLRNGEPASIAACGVHTFDAGVDGDIEGGRDESRGAARRQARQVRRQFWRRQRRRLKVLRILQGAGLLPPGDISTPEAIHQYFLRLDAELAAQWCSPETTDGERVMLPYRLRAAALDRRLTPYELGRALYHLAQRRGFRSSRKSQPKADEKPGEIKQEIGALYDEVRATGARTIGEFLSRLEPRQQRVRRRHTHRDMFTTEFAKIIESQAAHQLTLNPDVQKSLSKALFFQRPLKSQSELIGECDLIPGRKRAPLGLRIAQEFRLLQKINDLEIELPDGELRPLSAEEREAAVGELRNEGDLTFDKIRRLLKLPRGTRFNLERGDEKKLPGNRTESKLRKVFDDRWESMSEQHRDAVVEDLLSIEDPKALERRARGRWGLDEERAAKLADISLEQDRARHCAAALQKLVDRMRDGTHYTTARDDRELFPDRQVATALFSKLPPVLHAVKDLRNPAVCRALTELRKVVNSIIGRYGKPDTIHLELARDLRNPRKIREQLSKRMRERQSERQKIITRLEREAGISNPSAADIEKGLLWDECGGHCPYTGNPIAFQALFGTNPEFDVEHIIPLSRSLDDSFANKTLCFHEENRRVKRNRTPFEAYSADEQRWNEMLGRVKRFHGAYAEGKLRKFRMDETRFEEIYADFTQRQLNDTRYASKLAAEYLGCLFGGRDDADGRRRIQVSAGGVTAFLRAEWGLNAVLGLKGEKNRQDHRHHAVDALCIALAGPKTVKMLADAAENPEIERRRRFRKIQPPWDGFFDEAKRKILDVVVSRRVNRRVRGPLHLETNYGRPRQDAETVGQEVTEHHLRRAVTSLTSDKAVEAIVDDAVRRAVRDKLAEVDGDAKNLENDPPVLSARDGRKIPIRRVRVRELLTVATVGSGGSQRYVKPGANHHVVIVEVKGRRGVVKWEARPVTLLEAYRLRDAAGHPPIVRRDWGPDTKFVMSLVPGDAVLIVDEKDEESLCYVTSVSEKQCELRLHADARKAADVKVAGKAGGRLALSITRLQEMKARKVCVTHFGEVVPAND
ncbi:MAG: type II CRISPR RNA-guided endonuclease Cas9 [Planctomycetes bacterium]|nr:type II CRISPR RNA-guided endonuclease Cas9 [Planctomycetota bacterium]